jgi:hypothetical protein
MHASSKRLGWRSAPLAPCEILHASTEPSGDRRCAHDLLKRVELLRRGLGRSVADASPFARIASQICARHASSSSSSSVAVCSASGLVEDAGLRLLALMHVPEGDADGDGKQKGGAQVNLVEALIVLVL